jgi:hypothetical protein
MAHDVFLSYSYQDKVSADAVCHSLEAKGVRCWMAPRDVIPGEDWQQSLLDAIAAARAVILIFTGHTNQSENVKKEVSAAVDANTIVIPFFIEDVKPQGALKYHLSGVHWLDAYSPPLEEHVSHLASILKNLQPRPGDLPPAPIPASTTPPPPPPPAQPAPPVVEPPKIDPGAPSRWDDVPLGQREGFAFIAAVIPFAPGLYLLWRNTYRSDGDKVVPVSQTRKIIATALAALIILVVLAISAQLLKGGSNPPAPVLSGASSEASSAASAAAQSSSGQSSATSAATPPSSSAQAWTTASTDGKDRKIKFVNNSSHAVFYIYAWPTSGDEANGHDVMPDADKIETGQNATYTVDDGANDCDYNFKAVRADNASPIFVNNVDVCGVDSVTFSE